MTEYDGTPAARARRAMGRPPEQTDVPAGVGIYMPTNAAELAERRAAALAFHEAHGMMDAHGLTPAGHAMLDAHDTHRENMTGRGRNHLGVLSDDEARELVRRMHMDAEAVKVAGAAQVYGPSDANPATLAALEKVERANRNRAGIG